MSRDLGPLAPLTLQSFHIYNPKMGVPPNALDPIQHRYQFKDAGIASVLTTGDGETSRTFASFKPVLSSGTRPKKALTSPVHIHTCAWGDCSSGSTGYEPPDGTMRQLDYILARYIVWAKRREETPQWILSIIPPTIGALGPEKAQGISAASHLATNTDRGGDACILRAWNTIFSSNNCHLKETG